MANSTSADQTPRVAAGTDGRVSVVWQTNNGNREIQYRQRSAAAQWSTIDRLDADDQAFARPRHRDGHDNAVHVVWHEDRGSDWEIAYRTIGGGAGATWSPITYMTNPGAVDANARRRRSGQPAAASSWMDYENAYPREVRRRELDKSS